jgi:hypothetical protein
MLLDPFNSTKIFLETLGHLTTWPKNVTPHITLKNNIIFVTCLDDCSYTGLSRARSSRCVGGRKMIESDEITNVHKNSYNVCVEEVEIT